MINTVYLVYALTKLQPVCRTFIHMKHAPMTVNDMWLQHNVCHQVVHITSHTQVHMAKLHRHITSYFFFASCWWRYSLLMSWDSRDTGLSTCNHVRTHSKVNHTHVLSIIHYNPSAAGGTTHTRNNNLLQK